MDRALALAAEAGDRGEVPVGALLADADGTVIAEAGNAPIGEHDPTAHAEIRVLRMAGRRLANYRLPQTTLYVTLEPCVMCAGALVHARIARLVYGAADERAGACGSIMNVPANPQFNHRVEVSGGVLAERSAELLREFFAARR
jgi:tRNA(adenine34) deaminase